MFCFVAIYAVFFLLFLFKCLVVVVVDIVFHLMSSLLLFANYFCKHLRLCKKMGFSLMYFSLVLYNIQLFSFKITFSLRVLVQKFLVFLYLFSLSSCLIIIRPTICQYSIPMPVFILLRHYKSCFRVIVIACMGKKKKKTYKILLQFLTSFLTLALKN